MADTSSSSVPTQAAVIEAWEQRLKACPVYAKSTKVLAKEMAEAGELETVIKGVKETSRPYQAGDYIIQNPTGERYRCGRLAGRPQPDAPPP